jgi:hypothetical protein
VTAVTCRHCRGLSTCYTRCTLCGEDDPWVPGSANGLTRCASEACSFYAITGTRFCVRHTAFNPQFCVSHAKARQ